MRQVEEVGQISYETKYSPAAKQVDTYVRPAAPTETQFEKIAKSLTAINPAISKYLEKKDEEKRQYEEAIGVKIYQKALAEGKDLPAQEIRDKIKSGEITAPEAFKRFTVNTWNGIVKERHKNVAYTLTSHMRNWAQTAPPIINDDGTETPFAESQDENKKQAAFQQEMYSYIQQQTKGKYDPVLYKEHIEKYAEAATHNFIEQQAKEGLERIEREQTENLNTRLTAVTGAYIDEGKLITDKTGTVQQLAGQFSQAMRDAENTGMSRAESKTLVYQHITAAMGRGDTKGIEALYLVAQEMPELANDPAVMDSLRKHREAAESAYIRKKKEEMELKAIERKERVDDALMGLSETYGSFSKIPASELQNLRDTEKDPVTSKYIAETIEQNIAYAKQNSYFSNRIPDDDFERLRAIFRRGGGSIGMLAKYSAIPEDQYNDLYQAHQQHMSAMASAHAAANRASGGKGAAFKFKTNYEKVENTILKRICPRFDSLPLKQQDAWRNQARPIVNATYDQFRNYEAKFKDDPAALYTAQQDFLEKYAGEKYAAASTYVINNPTDKVTTQDEAIIKSYYKKIDTKLSKCAKSERKNVDPIIDRMIKEGKDYKMTAKDRRTFIKAFPQNGRDIDTFVKQLQSTTNSISSLE